MADEVASRVIVGVDGSTSSLGAVGWAGDYAAATGAPITLVAAWEWPTSYGWSIPMPVDYNPSGDAQRILDDAAATLRERHPSLSVETQAVEGPPAQVLVDASETAALLVVGCRGHGQLTGMIIGSVSERCVAHAHCPVLVYRREPKPAH
ncbi:MAG: universal stress protein [Actinomycetota bacterium]|nr:universal stress protein [Actinomycetota bacterium]